MRNKVLKKRFLVICLAASIAVSVVALRGAAFAISYGSGPYLTGTCVEGFNGLCDSIIDLTNPTSNTLCELVYTFTGNGTLNYCASYPIPPFSSVYFTPNDWTVGIDIVSAAFNTYTWSCPYPTSYKISPVTGLQAWALDPTTPTLGLPFYSPPLSSQTLSTLAYDCSEFGWTPGAKSKK